MENTGQVTQVIGATLDAQFAEDKMPDIYNALRLDVERTVLGETTIKDAAGETPGVHPETPPRVGDEPGRSRVRRNSG